MQNFLQFNGHDLYFTLSNGQWWIAIKPICEALNIEYTRVFKNVKKHKIYGAALAKQPMQIPGDQVRSMICLPEEFIYGWLFSLNSKSPELLEYQVKCNKILHEHFKGSIIRRRELKDDRMLIIDEISFLEKKLKDNPDFLAWKNKKAKLSKIKKALRELDESPDSITFL